MHSQRQIRPSAGISALVILLLMSVATHADTRAAKLSLDRQPAPANATASPEATASASTPLILSAPPRESAESGHRIFDPIARYLGQVLKRKVVYKHPSTWGGYQADMQAGNYDIVFDGPHFNGWRVARLGHSVVAKLPGEFVYTAVVRSDDTSTRQLGQLGGRKICAHAPPNLGTLIMYHEFDNPARQPVVVVIDGYRHIYESLLAGKCDAAMLPLKHLEKFEKGQARTRIIYRTGPMPQQAFSAGPRITPADKARISDALLATDVPALIEFRKTYGIGGNLVRSGDTEYLELAKYLRDTWGYY